MSRPVAGAQTLVDTLTFRAAHEGESRALTFLGVGTASDVSFTYAALDARVRALAQALQARMDPGSRAILLFPPGADYAIALLACLYAGVVAVPAYPPLGRRQAPRLAAIMRDAAPTLALSNRLTLTRCGAPLTELLEALGVAPLATDELVSDARDFRPLAIPPTALAFLQYTSGSTGDPKGAMIRHANVMANAALTYDAFGHGPESVSLLWVPPYHDMGLIGGLFQPLYGGFPGVLMSPLAFLRHPLGWLRAIATYGATTSGGPNFAYDLLAAKAEAEAETLAGLDLSGWKLAFNGAEPVRAATLERFSRAFAPYGFRPEAFYPCYGLAEATLIVSGGRASLCHASAAALDEGRLAAGHRPLVTSGRLLPGQTLAIVDPETLTPVAPGTIGEIWLRGPGVAGGYWQRPALSAEVFGAKLGGESYLRTGDLGALTHTGELLVTGRLKDLIIVAGRNHYPQDLEWTAEASHPALRAAAGCAFALETAFGEAVVLVHEVAPGVESPQAIAGAVRRALAAEHDVEAHQVVLVTPGGVPRTSSGKVRRSACRAAFLAGELPVVAAG